MGFAGPFFPFAACAGKPKPFNHTVPLRERSPPLTNLLKLGWKPLDCALGAYM
jgi:hypothetical protein